MRRSTFTKHLAIALFVTALFLPIGTGSTPDQPAEEPNIPTPAAQLAPKPYQARKWTATDAEPYKTMLRTIAEAKGLPEAKIREIEGVIQCESTWNPHAVGDSWIHNDMWKWTCYNKRHEMDGVHIKL